MIYNTDYYNDKHYSMQKTSNGKHIQRRGQKYAFHQIYITIPSFYFIRFISIKSILNIINSMQHIIYIHINNFTYYGVKFQGKYKLLKSFGESIQLIFSNKFNLIDGIKKIYFT